jgi:hypothetical protein
MDNNTFGLQSVQFLNNLQTEDIIHYPLPHYPLIISIKLRSMIKITYPDTKPSIKTESGKELIFCIIRKKWLTITPEEWVRQNFILYLIEILRYSRSLIAVEKKIKVGELEKRFDIVVYDAGIHPQIVVECKEMNVVLSGETLHQVLRYNIKLDAGLLVVTNGSFSYAFEKKDGAFHEVNELPGPIN